MFCLAGGTDAHAREFAELSHEPMFILHTVAAKMRITLKDDVPLPKLYYASVVQLGQFLVAVKTQGNIETDKVLNVYIVRNNEIYLNDSAEYYGMYGRTLDDSLAHEFVHYLQVKYHGYKTDDMDDSAEEQAVAIQLWFRENHTLPAHEKSTSADTKADCGLPGVTVFSEEPETADLASGQNKPTDYQKQLKW
jgi:hypothetical protein